MIRWRLAGSAASAAAALLMSAPAGAWGPQGHNTAGAIADRLLDDRARAAVAELLRDDLDAHGQPSHRTTLASVSTWADEIRGTPADRPKWHYDNRPACGTASRETFCADDACNTGQIPRLRRVLADPNASQRDRNEALKWIVHLVGDIHQPMHADDNGDRGGNSVKLILAGDRTRTERNLHSVWDTQFVRIAFGLNDRTLVPPEIETYTRQAKALVAWRGQLDAEAWAVESNRHAAAAAYNYSGFACGVTPTNRVTLNEEYQDRAGTIVRERVLLAGARLANLLNETLGER